MSLTQKCFHGSKLRMPHCTSAQQGAVIKLTRFFPGLDWEPRRTRASCRRCSACSACSACSPSVSGSPAASWSRIQQDEMRSREHSLRSHCEVAGFLSVSLTTASAQQPSLETDARRCSARTLERQQLSDRILCVCQKMYSPENLQG